MDAPTPNVPQAPQKKGKGWLIAIIVIIIIALAWYFFAPMTGNATVAVVDGEKISKVTLDKRVRQLQASLEAQGADLTDEATLTQLRQQTLDQLINEVLVMRDAKERGISISRSDVNDQFDIVAARFASTEDFQEELDSNKFTEGEYRDDIRRQLLIQRYLDALAEERGVTVSDEEVDQTYANIVAQATEEVPPLEDIRDDVIAAIEQQKVSQLLQDELLRLRDASSIEIMSEVASLPAPVEEVEEEAAPADDSEETPAEDEEAPAEDTKEMEEDTEEVAEDSEEKSEE